MVTAVVVLRGAGKPEMSPVLFGVLAALLIASALGVVLSRSPIRSALSSGHDAFFAGGGVPLSRMRIWWRRCR